MDINQSFLKSGKKKVRVFYKVRSNGMHSQKMLSRK